ncbi:MAG: 30S ribosomal protein S12 methylthiotransferase RimO [Elusimicrobia bacterium]|nr:30S ribosomal protein S12 methylthiotransferase RimO [Elusimicrobiota bacterium]
MRAARSKNICVISLGCSKNTVDSERLMKQLELNNFRIVDSTSGADTVIINTCGFIGPAKEESIDTILQAVSLKEEGRLRKVIVFGCLAERYGKELPLEIKEVDAFFGVEKYREILSELGGKVRTDKLPERRLSGYPGTAFLKISEGCSNRCSYCVIPSLRGPYRSLPLNRILREAEILARRNIKELVLIGQDTADYGRDIYGKRRLDALLGKLGRLKGIEWIRLMYMHPAHLDKRTLTAMKDNPRVCRYIDLPLQHISDRILKSMNRKITSKGINELIERIRKTMPGAVLRTTFMIGYPGETEEEFGALCRFVKKTGFDRLGVFAYSAEEGTASSRYPDSVPGKVKEKRMGTLMDIQRDISYVKNRALLGKTLRVIVDGCEGSAEEGFYTGRSQGHAPEVDGDVLMKMSGKKLRPGGFYEVKIYDCDEYDLFGAVE